MSYGCKVYLNCLLARQMSCYYPENPQYKRQITGNSFQVRKDDLVTPRGINARFFSLTRFFMIYQICYVALFCSQDISPDFGLMHKFYDFYTASSCP